MAYETWSQDVFSKGELSPFMYGRPTVAEYGYGLKTAQNVLTYPTGAAGKRFGTLYQATLSGFTSFDQLFFQTFQYLNECVYQLVFTPLNIAIYLEGILIANVTTQFDAKAVYNLSNTTLNAAFRVAGVGLTPTSNKPFDLTRSASAANVIVSAASNEFTLTAAITSGLVLPVRFTTTGTLPVTVPQIKAGITYFVKNTSTSTVKVYSTAYDAKFDLNAYTITNAGTGTNNLIPQNTWTLANCRFKEVPFYDFDDGYDGINFTVGTPANGSVEITLSGTLTAPATLDSKYVGGAFFGGGGSGRITVVTDTTHFTVFIVEPFTAGDVIPGKSALLAEPAWSDARGWPIICSSYQNRALFANTASLPNGFFASAINDYADFGDLTNDDDDAISWYPSSDNVNFIRFIVPYRSITVHTNTGIYSSPLSDIGAITPKNFTLQLQDSTPADVLLPQAIDNQVVVLSGNDAHQMLWDGINNAYTSDIVSVISEQLIRDPVDETPFADLRRAGSRYIFIINANGSMAIFQTLISQNVAGLTPAIVEQSYGESGFLQAASSADGRCWFVVQREFATAAAPIAITGFTAETPTVNSYLTAVASNISTTVPLAITFTTTGTLPASTPAIAVSTYYWALGRDADNFYVYLTQDDALEDVNAIAFTSAGVNSNVVKWPLADAFTLEELTQETFLDCAVYYNGAPTSTVTTGALFNAQDVKMVGATTAGERGYGFEAVGVGNAVAFEAHGEAVLVSEAYIGFPINTIMEPMPLTMANGPSAKNTTLTLPKHVRSLRFMFNDTIGGTINGVPIAIKPFDEVQIGDPPVPGRGFIEMMPMGGWDDFNTPLYTIEHSDPFNIQLLGVFYSVEV